MKIKLFRIFSLIFVLSSVLSLMPAQPALADPKTEAIKIIVSCKGRNGPFQQGSMCHQYERCIYGEPGDREGSGQYCNSVAALNPTISALSGATLEGCRRTMTHEQCTDAFVKCLQSKLDDGGNGLDPDTDIPFAETDKCKAAIAKGDATGGAGEEKKGGEEENKSTCVIVGIGWIVCPIMTLMAKVVDGAYSVVASLLTVQPLLTGGNSQGIYTAWSYMRNLANVAFVVAFLIIIFSQVSSIGITNYGIKRMLPRLVIAAVLVNISYWICAIAIDISNILGASFGDLFKTVEAALVQPDAGKFGAEGKGWEGIVGGFIAGTAVAAALLYVGLSALLPMLLAAVLAIVTVFLVLALRQALIILLVVIAPLAFVAYLLPNTESLFKKWKDLFQTLLMMYPLIAIIFGASSLASQVIMASAPNDKYKFVIQIMGAGVAIIPLAITPLVMKVSGGVLNRFGGFINNPNKGPYDRLRKGAEGFRKNRQMLRDTNALGDKKYRFGQSVVRRNARRQAVIGSREAVLKDFNTAYIAGQAVKRGPTDENGEPGEVGDNRFARQMAGGGYFTEANENVKAAVVASAISQEKKMFQDDVKSMEALVRIKFENNPEEALKQALASGDRTQAVAAQNILFASGSGGISRFRETVQNAEASGDPGVQAGLAKVNEELKTNVRENHGQYAKQKGADVTSWANAKPDENGNTPKLSNTDYTGTLSDSELAGQHSGSLQKMVDHGRISEDQVKNIKQNKRILENLDDDKKAILGRTIGEDWRPRSATPEQLDIAHEKAIAEEARRNRPQP